MTKPGPDSVESGPETYPADYTLSSSLTAASE